MDAVKFQLNWAEVAPAHQEEARRVRRQRPVGLPGLGEVRRRGERRAERRLPGDGRPQPARARLGHGATRATAPAWTARAARSSPASPRPSASATPRSTCGRSGTSPTTRASSTRRPRSGGSPTRRTSTASLIKARHRRAAAVGPRRRPDPVRRAAADRQGAHLPQEHHQAAALPARVLLPRLEAGAPTAAAPPPAHGCKGYQQDHRRERLRLPPLHPPGGPAGQEPTSDDATIRSIGRITRALDIARRAGPHRRRQAERLEHGVRLPVQPARPLSAPASPASPASCPSPSGSRTATGAWPAARSTRCATPR